jgi:hypothetical protein
MNKNGINYEAIKKEWDFIPSLKGKQAKMNIRIMRLLTKEPSSTWNLAKAYLEAFNTWTTMGADTQYHKRQKQNSVIYKRLKELQKMQYVEKIENKYRLTFKGCFFMVIIDPSVADSIHIDDKVAMLIHDPSKEPLRSTLNEIAPGLPFNNESFEAVKLAVKNPLANETLSFVMKRLLQLYKVNLDAIGDATLFEVLIQAVKDQNKSLVGGEKQ